MQQDDDDTTVMFDQFRGIVNKIIPREYHDLVKNIVERPIRNEDRFEQVKFMLFDMAHDELFSVDHAKDRTRPLPADVDPLYFVLPDRSRFGKKFHRELVSDFDNGQDLNRNSFMIELALAYKRNDGISFDVITTNYNQAIRSRHGLLR